MTADDVITGPWERANRDQGRASHPDASVWVSANAGSGKTHVLVNRIIRLMLAGVPPERILCLTYTRAAAAEMSRRLFDVLSSWIPLDDEALIGRIHTLSGYVRFGGELTAARRLFARALETPGGLKIQTIHAFCERLLQRFPVEAGVVPGFAVMDEIEARELLAEARRSVLGDAGSAAGETGAALATVVAFAGEPQLDGLIKELLSKRSELTRLLGEPDLRRDAMLALSRVLDIGPEDREEAIWAAACDGMDRDRYAAAGAVLDGCSGKRDRSQGGLIADALAGASPEQVFATLKDLFLKQDGQPKTDSYLCSAGTRRDHPEIAAFLGAEQARIAALAEKECAVKIRDASTALFGLADGIIARYEAEKRRLGRYDYDDLIGRTLSMFREVEHAAWVLYKLDGGLDHILIDEAQDTSPEQWQIVKYLAEEFFAGEGQRPDVCRTVFAVGDRKQSIFSFQGADPDGFDAMRRYFEDKAREARLAFETVRPTVSFRAVQTVLDAVDAVFAAATAADGVKEEGEPAIVHHAVREGQAGLVEIWEPETADAADSASPWQAGSARDPAAHPRLVLARRIAATIRGWLDNGETLAASGQPIRPGDILILVRSRTTFMDALVRAVKQAGIAVAGADRLVLTKHIAIQDLLALARFTLLPDDDLTLATVLKSPLLARDDGAAIDDDDLLRLAWKRSGTLWAQLHAAVAEHAPYGAALERLKRWRAASDFMPPYEFFAQVLTGDGGRRAIIERLGAEASEPLDAFLAYALDFAPGRATSLQAFVAAVEDSDAEIKRDMDHGADEVRVMTVHGAKGLEAPVVFLPDTCDALTGRHDPAILVTADEGGEPVPLWRLRTGFQTPPIEALRNAHQRRARQEHNRLLYVAMTRARDRLYVCGCQTTKELKEGCWYDLIASALRPQAQEFRLADGRLAWRIEGGRETLAARPESELEPPLVPVEPPAWAGQAPQPEPPAMRWLVASRLDAGRADRQSVDPEPVTSPLSGADERRFRRGRLIHRLLQGLPDLQAPQRRQAAQRYLTHAAGDLDTAARDAIVDEVLAVLDHPSLRALFGPGSLAEVPVAAVLDRDAQRIGLTGQIDRLAVDGDEVLIADYKTNRPPPAGPEQAEPQYIRQLAAYRAALARLYPGRRIRCALVWTDGPRLMEIPAAMLDAALPMGRVKPA